MSMKLKSITKYKDGDKSIKVKSTTPSFADKIKPLSAEQKAKGEKINELDKKKKLFDDGTKKLKKDDESPYAQEGKPRKMSLTTTTTSTGGSTGSIGSARIKEETMQKDKTTGKVNLVEGFKDPNNKDRSGQESLRKKALEDANKNIGNYKHGDKITYNTPKGKQHAGTVEKIEAIPASKPTVTTTTKKEFVASTPAKSEKAPIKAESTIASERAAHPASEGWYKKNNVWLKESKSGNYETKKPKGTVADSIKKQKELNKKADGAKKMKLYNKGSKMC